MVSKAHFPYVLFFFSNSNDREGRDTKGCLHWKGHFSNARDCLGTAKASLFPWVREEFTCPVVSVDTLHLGLLNYLDREVTWLSNKFITSEKCEASVLKVLTVRVPLFGENVPTPCTPAKAFYMTNFQVELSWKIDWLTAEFNYALGPISELGPFVLLQSAVKSCNSFPD